MAACRLAARGRSLSDNTYESEVKSILNFLEIQRPAHAPAISPSVLDISPEDYISPRHVKKLKNKVRQTLVNSSIYGPSGSRIFNRPPRNDLWYASGREL